MLSLAAALLLSAQPSNAWLDEARALIEKLEFAQAVQRLEVARQVPGNDAATTQTILELTAYCQVAEGKRDEAEKTFIALLELDPAAELSRDVSSPKVVEAFTAARRRHFPPDYVKLAESPAPAGRAQLELVDPWKQIARVVLHQRRDEQAWTEAPLEGDGGRFSFPLVVKTGGQLDWFVEALDADGTARASIGSLQTPRTLRVPLVVQEAESAPEVPTQTRRIIGIATLSLGIVVAAVATGLELGAWNQRIAARDRTRAPGDFASTALAAERNALTQQGWAIGLFIGSGVSLATGLVLAW